MAHDVPLLSGIDLADRLSVVDPSQGAACTAIRSATDLRQHGESWVDVPWLTKLFNSVEVLWLRNNTGIYTVEQQVL
jgi:hypothetical protein